MKLRAEVACFLGVQVVGTVARLLFWGVSVAHYAP